MSPPAFDTFVAIDWSGARGFYNGIAVARCARGRAAPELVSPEVNARWSRTEIAEWLCEALKGKRRMLIGMDFAFGFPFEEKAGYLQCCNEQQNTVFDLWKLIEDGSGNESDFGCDAFTCDPRYASLFWKSGQLPEGWVARKRLTELACAEATSTRPESVYKLIGSKQVGKASLTGIRVLHHVRGRAEVSFWPFENPRGSTITEIYPTLFRKATTGSVAKIRSVRDLNKALEAFRSEAMPRTTRDLSDHETDALISAAGLRCIAMKRATWSHPDLASPRVRREGWIFGVAEGNQQPGGLQGR